MSQTEYLFVTPGATIREGLECLNKNCRGIVLVVCDGQKLVCTLTDGDFRRAILGGLGLTSTIQSLLDNHNILRRPSPVTAPQSALREELIELMQEHKVQHLPLLDHQDRVVDVACLKHLLKNLRAPGTALIMAGGFGKRLKELTRDTPKPMLPVGEIPLIERIVKQLRDTGISRVQLSTHYQAARIEEHFGDGSHMDVEIEYLHEDEPLGTAGALGSMEIPERPVLVINGDILTNVDFSSMGEYHEQHMADLTVAVRKYDVKVPYGVMETDDWQVVSVKEKPVYELFVNAGIYLLSPSAFEYIVKGRRMDMPELIERLIQDHRRVASFPIFEYWLDVGQPEDYQQAIRDVNKGLV